MSRWFIIQIGKKYRNRNGFIKTMFSLSIKVNQPGDNIESETRISIKQSIMRTTDMLMMMDLIK